MTDTLLRAGALSCALLATTCLTVPALAQSNPPTPPVFRHADDNGVDLARGTFTFSVPVASIGVGEAGLSLVNHFGAIQADNWNIRFRRSQSGSNATITITLGDSSETFTGGAGATSFASDQGTGATLTKSLSAGGDTYVYTLVAADGTTTRFGFPSTLPYRGGDTGFCVPGREVSCALLAQSSAAPSGRTVSFSWRARENCTLTGESWNCVSFYRLASASNNSGYAISFGYENNTDPTSGLPNESWYRKTGATLSNQQVAGAAVSVSYQHPSAAVTEITDGGGRTWKITRNPSQHVTGIQRPGSSSDNVTIAYSDPVSGVVSQVVADGVATNYARSVSGSTATLTVTNAVNPLPDYQLQVVSDLTIGRPTSVRDALKNATTYSYDASGRPWRVTAPEGNYVDYQYDSRGNVTLTRAVPKGGAGPVIETGATYASGCANVVICNRPLTTTDARGNVTEYDYDPVHGGIRSVTGPAPSQNAPRPQIRTTYTLIGGIQLPTAVSVCRTQSSCAGTADEVRTTVQYGANNLPSSVATGAGDGSLTATRSFGYDGIGNLTSVDGPFAGAIDAVRYRYDSARRRTATIGIDPDGTGALTHPVERITYRQEGQVSRIESGNIADPGADLATMTVRDKVEIGFDTLNRPTSSTFSAGGTTFAVAHTGYDVLGRPECTAQRMDPSDWGAGAAGACFQDPSRSATFGADRIRRIERDAAGRTSRVLSGVGVLGANLAGEVEAATTYTPNGQVETLTDGENNRTTYEYDGLDRLGRTRFPVAAAGQNASSATDYEELAYESVAGGTRTSGLVVSRRLRDEQVVGFQYDSLGRLALRDRPGTEPDVGYGYDLLGRMISASQPGHSLVFTWDSLGRQTTEAGPLGTMGRAFDVGGRRTALAFHDGKVFSEWRDVVGRMTLVGEPYRENTNDWIVARYWYDDAGRRTTTVRGAGLDGTTTGFSYDAASRLTSIAHNLSGTADDLTLGFSYNPAGQIVSNSRSNDLHTLGSTAGTAVETPNGRNQLVERNGATLLYDRRGNLTDDGAGRTYAYDSDNRLVSSTAGGVLTTLTYDPLGRLYSVTSGGNTRRFAYDGQTLLSEHDGATQTLLRRFVHGPGVDEPAAYYEGDALGLLNRTYPHQDERGSVVAVANANGTRQSINRYDEYGVPQGTLAGRFGYTGQMWIPELGLSYYRARMYDPLRGRFLQADPIGYGDGMNMYTYVGGDPVNRTDPSGMIPVPCNAAETRIRMCDDGPRDDSEVGFGHESVHSGGGGWGGGGAADGGAGPLLEWARELGGTADIEVIGRRRRADFDPQELERFTQGVIITGFGLDATTRVQLLQQPALDCRNIDPEVPNVQCRGPQGSTTRGTRQPPALTDEERHRRTCELLRRSGPSFADEFTVGLGSFVKGTVGRFFSGVGGGLLYLETIRQIDMALQRCEE